MRLPACAGARGPAELPESADNAGLRGGVPRLHRPVCQVQSAKNLFSIARKRTCFRWENSAQPGRSSARPAESCPGGIEFRRDRNSNFRRDRCWDSTDVVGKFLDGEIVLGAVV